MFNQVITTRNLYNEQVTPDGIILGKQASIKEYQTVIAVGPSVHGISPGDIVFINPLRYMVVNHKNGKLDKERNIQEDNMHAQFNIPTLDLYDQPDGSSRKVLIIGDNDVQIVAEGEEFETAPVIAKPDNDIIKPS